MTARARKKATPAAAKPEPAIAARPVFTSVPPAPRPRLEVSPCPSPITLTLEFGMYGAHSKPQKGALWRASFYDAEQGQFYAGSDDDAFCAIAWALYEREERIGNHGAPTMTRAGNVTPLEALERLRGRS